MESRRPKTRSVVQTQVLIRSKANDFAQNFKRTIEWARKNRDVGIAPPSKGPKSQLARSPTTVDMLNSPQNKALVRRHSNAFL
jgi:hypothetical protein